MNGQGKFMGWKRRHLAMTVLLMAGAWSSEAAAACTRQIINRSAYVLTVSQNGGPVFTIRPRAARSIRMSEPGSIDFAAHCPGSRLSRLAPADPAASVAQASFSYNAVLDRCYFEIGLGFFDNELGRGFFPRADSQPFALNNPRQGDIVLGPFTAECPLIR
jgi:hypothetical protein